MKWDVITELSECVVCVVVGVFGDLSCKAGEGSAAQDRRRRVRRIMKITPKLKTD